MSLAREVGLLVQICVCQCLHIQLLFRVLYFEEFLVCLYWVLVNILWTRLCWYIAVVDVLIVYRYVAVSVSLLFPRSVVVIAFVMVAILAL